VNDAVVIGSGPNGLVAANMLADHGWQVAVLEEQPTAGGAVRSAEVTLPGYTSDLFSAFYPLAAASRVLRELELEKWGIRWTSSDLAVAHPQADGSCALLSRDLDETAAALDRDAPGDGEAWRDLYELWTRVGGGLIDALMTPFPPVRPGARMLAALRKDLLRFARLGMLPVRRLGQETFSGQAGRNLLAGNALHADLTPESAGSGLYGWVLCGLGQQFGFPVPEGGSGRLSEALANRLVAGGGTVSCDRRVQGIVVRNGRAAGVRTADGEVIEARRAVLADTGAHQLYLELLPREDVPNRVIERLGHLHLDNSTIKVDWALDKPIPWAAAEAGRAGTIHIADGVDALTEVTSGLAQGRIPERPFLVLGQYSMTDPTRAPAGSEVAWAYTHVPQDVRSDVAGSLTGKWDERELETFVARMEDEVERVAPGFKETIRARHVAGPRELERANRNLVGGAINNGTAQLHQQLVFRPIPGLGRSETPVAGVYLCSAAAHPGGGVHGGPGSNAARAAIAHDRARRFRAALPGPAKARAPQPST
jgi:phytoene dehydrogenase-like protein